MAWQNSVSFLPWSIVDGTSGQTKDSGNFLDLEKQINFVIAPPWDVG
jgi:hypothetical protein